MFRRLALIAIISAALGATALFFGISKSAEAYSQVNAGIYSPANHFISELGWKGRSPGAEYFNRGLLAFCSLSIPLIVALGIQLRTGPGYTAMVSGVGMLLAGIAVAIFPLENRYAHMLAASLFFFAFLFTMVFFTAAFYYNTKGARSIGMVAAGLVCITAAVTFLIFPKDSIGRALRNIQEFDRPPVWWLAIVEWGILGSGIVWGASAAVVLFRWLPSDERSK